MVWVRIDDGACDHPKLLEAGPEAAWLWLRGLAYCNRFTTNGLIKHSQLAAVGLPWQEAKRRRLAAELVRVNLWESVPEGFLVHDYHEQQSAAMTEEARDAALEKRKAQDAARSKRYREKTQSPRNASRDEIRDADSDESRIPVSAGARVIAAARTRPDPDPDPVLNRNVVLELTPQSGVQGSSSESTTVAALPRNPEPGDEAFSALTKGFQKRFEALTQTSWYPNKHYTNLQLVAAWCAEQSTRLGLRVGQVTATTLEEFFADEYARKECFPIEILARNPTKYFTRNRAAQEHIESRKGVA